MVTPPATASLTEELRTHDRLVRRPPARGPGRDRRLRPRAAVAPGTRRRSSPPTSRSTGGRSPAAGRRRSWPSRTRCWPTQVWDAAGVARAPYRLVDLADDAALAAATDELGGELGAVWAGDARDGFNGGGNFVRWVRDDRDRAAAAAFFRPRCDRVRVMPFLDGVPCSIHGFVLPDGTAALRPVEIVIAARPGRPDLRLRRPRHAPGTRRRPTARRCATPSAGSGAHLQRAHGYRGAFGIDGVLTADGFRPTELNTRMSAGASAVAEPDRRFFTFLQAALVAGVDTGLAPADVEALVAGDGRPPRREGRRSSPRASTPRRGGVLPGRLGRRCVHPCGRARPATCSPSARRRAACSPRSTPARRWWPAAGSRPVNAALLAYVDATYGSALRADRAGARPAHGRRLTWRGSWWSAAASAASPRRPGWPSSATRSPCWSGSTPSAGRSRRSPRTASSGTRARRRRWSRRWSATCSARAAARSSASWSSSRWTWSASTGSRTAPCSACPATPAPPSSRLRRPRAGAGPRVGRRTSTRSPTTGRCCAAPTSRTRGTPTTSRVTWRRGWTAARCCTSGCGRRSRTSGSARWPRTRSSPRATTCATCRRGRGWSPTSSSSSARGRCPAGWPGSPRR